MEFLTWYLQGLEALDAFSEKRSWHSFGYYGRRGDFRMSESFYEEISKREGTREGTEVPGAYPKEHVIHVSEPRGEISESQRAGTLTSGIAEQQIKELRKHPNCTEFIRSFIRIVETSMICNRSQSRISCKSLIQQMETMIEECKKHPAQHGT